MKVIKKSEKASVMAEFAIILPLMVFITFGTFQLAFLFVADSVMEYAAFTAARSYVVQITNTEEGPEVATQIAADSALKAASMVTSLISFFDENNEGITIPGQGELKYSSYSVNHTEIDIYADGNFSGSTKDGASLMTVVDPNEIEIVVHFEYKPMFPALTIPTLNVTEAAIETDDDGTIKMQKNCKMITTL